MYNNDLILMLVSSRERERTEKERLLFTLQSLSREEEEKKERRMCFNLARETDRERENFSSQGKCGKNCSKKAFV